MRDTLVVNAWVGVQDGCEIICKTEGKHGAYFTVRSADAPPFEFSFAAGALRQFLAVRGKAQADLDELSKQRRAHSQPDQRPVTCVCQSAERSA